MILCLRHDDKRADKPGGMNIGCRHEWVGAHLPMDAASLAKLLEGVRCPACGGGGGIRVVDAREPSAGESLR